jgi:hypothetical protein
MANPTPLFNRVGYVVMLAGSVLIAMHFSTAFPLAAIAVWILGFDMLRVSVGWNWSRSAARPTVPEEFKRLLMQDFLGPKVWAAVIAALLFWFFRRVPIDTWELAVYILGLSVISGALREWRLRSTEHAVKARAIQTVLAAWALCSALYSLSRPLHVVDLYGFLYRYWLMIPLGLLGEYALYQAILRHPARSEKLMDAED